jgi:hypothetical protein
MKETRQEMSGKFKPRETVGYIRYLVKHKAVKLHWGTLKKKVVV